MTELMRDTAFGQLLRLLSGRKLFQYYEERDPSVWKKFLNADTSANLARYGTATDRGKEDKSREPDGEAENEKEYGAESGDLDGPQNLKEKDARRDSSASSATQPVDDGHTYNMASGVRVDTEQGKDVNIVDWDGPDDPENPMNWSRGKKFFVTFEICLLTFAVYIGSAIYSAGEQGVVTRFGVSVEVATLGLTLFVAGYGLGPMIWSPMSEIPQIGRNPIYITTLCVFVFLQFAVIYSVNIGMLLAFRFITGFVGSPVLATGGASLADMYVPRKRAYAISIWGVAAICGPVLGPLVAGFAVENKNWQWAIWELMWLSGFALVFLFFFLPETSSANILYRRTSRIRALTGNQSLRCVPELAGEDMTGKDIALMVLVRPITLNFTEPMVFLLNLYIALIYGLLYVWFESFEIVFVEIYGFSLGTEGLAYVGILVGAILVIPGYFAYLYYIQEPQFNENGEIKPEKRLPAACVGSFFIPICLFWFGWSAGRTHWIVPIIGSSCFSIGAFLLFNAVLNYLGDAYPTYAASVLAGNDLMRSSFGAGFPLFARAMYDRLGVDWASSLLGFLGILFIPIPFVLWWKGETLRVNYSKKARKDL